MTSKSVGIVGAGFSGSLLAVHLLGRLSADCSITLVEKSSEFGRGLAYSTDDPHHLLNVPAKGMSAFKSDRGHFVRWLETRLGLEAEELAYEYVPRSLFGAYVQDLVATNANEPGSRLKLRRGEAQSLHPKPHGATLTLASGERLDFDAVILAMGNFAPAAPSFAAEIADSPRFLANPWESGVIERITDPDAPVLVIGTGLTMIDFAISLREKGHTGQITALSRRGLLPRRHAVFGTPMDWDVRALPNGMAGLVKAFRARIRAEEAEGVPWQDAMRGLHRHVNTIWRRLPLAERRRFLRHLLAYWSVHRFRMAPRIADRIEAEIRAGGVNIVAGRIAKMASGTDGIAVQWRPRGQDDIHRMQVGYVVNCAGPNTDISQVPEPFISNLRNDGVIRPDPLKLGIDVTDDGRVISAGGEASAPLFAIGPITRGRAWEVAQVPDIRRECEFLADRLANLLGRVHESVA